MQSLQGAVCLQGLTPLIPKKTSARIKGYVTAEGNESTKKILELTLSGTKRVVNGTQLLSVKELSDVQSSSIKQN